MDEENNNQEQNEQDKVQDVAQDTARGVKDGANLAKNAASGNYLGAAKDAVNLAKNKTIRRRIIIKTALSILAPIIFVVIVACVILGVFDAVGDGIQSVIESIGEFFTVDLSNDLEIKITDEALNAVIASIESMGVSLDDLHLMGDVADYNDPDVEEKNKEALRKYLRQFYEAQAVTKTLYPSPSWYQQIGNKTYGTVYVQRVKNDDTDLSKVTKLTYIPYDQMVEKQTTPTDRQIEDIMEYFSINPDNGKLVVPNTTKTIVKLNGNQTKNETVIGLTEIDYKSVISQYTTSMNFLVYLTMVTQNPEFAASVADLVKDSDIRITIMDKVTTNITNEERNYTVNSKWIEKVEHTSYSTWDTYKEYPYTTYTYEERYGTPQKKTDITETTVVSTTPVPNVNYAKTWFSEQTIEYNKKDTPMQENSFDTEPNNEDEPEISGEGSSATWITDDVTTITTSGATSQYEEGTIGNVVYTVGEKGDGKKSFVGLLDEKFRIPNTSRKESESAGSNLVSGAEYFFHLLQKDANSQNLEIIVRYALYKYTGNSYGVTTLDNFSVFNIRNFSSVSGIKGGSTEEKVWFALLSAGYSKYAAAGVLGNLSVESSFITNNVQGSYLQPNQSQYNADYTEKVNTGTISSHEFIYNGPGGGGYGLAQWTSSGRKQGLYNFAQSRGVSIDDVDMQIEYLLAEITGTGADGFATCQIMTNKGYNVQSWTDATSEAEAAKSFCWIFERPYEWDQARVTRAEEYYQRFKDLDAGGTYTEGSSEYGVKGYYTSSRGRTFTVLDQTKISGWSKCCNRAACAIIASGYSEESSNELIASRNSATATLYGVIPANGSPYWEKYGLKITYTEDNTNDYMEKLKNQLMSGGYAMIWINNNESNYYGKSGTLWTTLYHWIAIIDYKQENGVEKMCIADWNGIRWVELDEFTTHGVNHLIFVNEK